MVENKQLDQPRDPMVEFVNCGDGTALIMPLDCHHSSVLAATEPNDVFVDESRKSKRPPGDHAPLREFQGQRWRYKEAREN